MSIFRTKRMSGIICYSLRSSKKFEYQFLFHKVTGPLGGKLTKVLLMMISISAPSHIQLRKDRSRRNGIWPKATNDNRK